MQTTAYNYTIQFFVHGDDPNQTSVLSFHKTLKDAQAELRNVAKLHGDYRKDRNIRNRYNGKFSSAYIVKESGVCYC
jgi:hypothetical protein